MPQPPLFVPPYDFSSELGTQHGTHLDVTFDGVGDVAAAIIGNLGLIQRDDGALRNQLVTVDSLHPAVVAAFADGGLNPRGPWVTATAYAKFDLATSSGVTYVCVVAHTSAALFSTDLSANRWMIFSDATTPTAGGTSFTPAGNIAATNVQLALQELDNEKAGVNGSASQAFSVAAASTPNQAPRVSQVQGDIIGYCVGTGTGDAILGTISVGGISGFVDGMQFRIRAPGANSLTTPTLNLTVGAVSSGALTFLRGDNGEAMAAGDIANSSHELIVQYRSGAPSRWLLINPASDDPVRYNPATTRFEGWNGAAYVPIGEAPTGLPSPWFGSSAPAGWVFMHGGTIGSATSGASVLASATAETLYTFLWNNVLDAYCPVTGGRGASAAADFAANKPLRLPDGRGRFLMGAPSGTVVETLANTSFNAGTDRATVASNVDKWITGMQVTFNVTSGTAPVTSAANQLDNGDTVWVVRIDDDEIGFASSLANAQNGTLINVTDVSAAGAYTITHTFPGGARAVGSGGGEEKHAMSSTEILAHQHTDLFTNPGGGGVSYDGNGGGADNTFTNPFGGNAAMNITPPYLAVNWIIKL